MQLTAFLRQAAATFPDYKESLKTGLPWDAWFSDDAFASCAKVIARADRFVVEAKSGSGYRSEVPWIGFRRRDSTFNFMRGIYVAYLFAPDRSAVYLSLQQGVTSSHRSRPGDFGRPSKKDEPKLRLRAQQIRGTLSIPNEFRLFDIDLGAQKARPRSYNAGHILGRRYLLDALPAEEEIIADLNALLALYDAMDGILVSTVEPSVPNSEVSSRDSLNDPLDPDQLGGDVSEEAASSPERLNRIIAVYKRDRALAQDLKRIKHFTCERCNTKPSWLTAGGDPYVECHHLVPLGQAGADDLRNLIVLCSDCHRRLHFGEDASSETARLLAARR